ncbi:MAG: DUF447 family protein [Gammaproteobacteria bacterium]|nr:DUF447 family protein [Gammaproteobacteria bacterium]
MPFIRECIVTTVRENGSTHIAPMGIHDDKGSLVILPFKPSSTLDNLERHGTATLNYTDDVRIYAGCLTGRSDWPTCSTEVIEGMRLENCLAHTELEVTDKIDDPVRPKFFCKTVHEEIHGPYYGYNRAQSAVIELAILVSRLHMLPLAKIHQQIEYLKICVDKTAGPRETEAWGWLMEKVDSFQISNKENLQ